MTEWIYIMVLTDKNGVDWIKPGMSKEQTPWDRADQVKRRNSARECRIAWTCRVADASLAEQILFETCEYATGEAKDRNEFWQLTEQNRQNVANQLQDTTTRYFSNGTYYDGYGHETSARTIII